MPWPQHSLRLRLLVVGSLTATMALVSPLLLQLWANRQVWQATSSFRQQRLERTQRTIQFLIQPLITHVRDYSTWSEMNVFLDTRDRVWAEQNLANWYPEIPTVGIDSAVVISPQQQVIFNYSKTAAWTAAELRLLAQQRATFPPEVSYIQRADGLYIVIVSSIANTTDPDHSQGRGLYAVGQRLDTLWLEQLAELTLEDYVLHDAAGSVIAATFIEPHEGHDHPIPTEVAAILTATPTAQIAPASLFAQSDVLAEDPYVGFLPLYGDTLVGWLELHFSVPSWYFVPLRMQTAWVFLITLSLVIAGGVWLLLQRWIMQPISQMRSAVQQLRLAPNTDWRSQLQAPSEIKELNQAFGNLVEQLQYQVQREHFLSHLTAWVNQSRELDTIWPHIWGMTQALGLGDVLLVYHHLPNRVHCRFSNLEALPVFGPSALYRQQFSYIDAVFTGNTVEITNLMTDARVSEVCREHHRSHRLAAVLALPLWGQDDVWGSLILGSHHERTWDQTSRQLLDNVTEQLAAALERQEALHHIQVQTQQLHSHNQALEDFISALGHDLRNPLFSQRVALTTLQQQLMSTQQNQSLLKNAHNCLDLNQALTHLVENLLHISRYQAGRKTLYREVIEWSDLITGVYQLFGPALAAKHIQWLVAIAPELPQVQADSVEISRVVQNIVANAIRHTPPHGQIQIEIDTINDGVRVLCHDNGAGIEREIQAVLFQRFFQAGRSAATGSTGMGLYLCRQIIDAHNGNIGVVSQPGQGSTFWFDLPSYPITHIGRGLEANA